MESPLYNVATVSAAKSPEWKFLMGIHPGKVIHREALKSSIQQVLSPCCLKKTVFLMDYIKFMVGKA